ncbi:MAG: 16S rRNA (cytosine(967)-C(5))-methyltransferase RsmB [Syntrophomonas sp.]
MQKYKNQKRENDPRKLSLLVVYNVLEKGAYTNILLDRYLRNSDLASDDRHLVTEIVNGTVRMLKHLDWVLNLFLRKPIDKQNPWLRNILRISLYQMLFMEKIPDYASINSAVVLTRNKVGPGLGAVVNGVLRNIARNRDSIKYPDPKDIVTYFSVYYSQPEWLIERWLVEYDLQLVQDMLAYFNRRPTVFLRNNQLSGNREELIEDLTREGICCLASSRSPWGLLIKSMHESLQDSNTYQQGRFYVQNEASMLAVSILNPQAGEQIVDLCCGVGGKTSFMAELMNNSGHIDAYDIHKHKIDLLTSNCARLGISIVIGHLQDILSLPEGQPWADGVLLDAPCSGLGVLNRRADSRWKKTPDVISDLQELQSRMLHKAGQLVRPGGRLVYSTCTINRAENEAIIMEFLQRNPNFIREGFTQEISYFPLDGLDTESAEQGMLTVLPGKYETDGMFYARMRRIES